MENKDIVEALEQVPALVKAAETFKATSGRIISSLADAVKQRPQAEIPESELQKISETPCAPPDMRLTKRCMIFGLASFVLASIIAIIAVTHYNSDVYWGKQFNKVYSSPYLTEEERELIQRNYYTVAILPTEYQKDPSKAKEQLKRAKAILKKRKKELKKNN